MLATILILIVMPAYYLSLPVLFLKFWFFEAPLKMAKYFLSVNHALLQFLSLPLLTRTFFKPLKNEYRKGLVVFSLVFGMIVKSAFISVGLLILGFFVFVEVFLIILFVLWPFLSFYILFI